MFLILYKFHWRYVEEQYMGFHFGNIFGDLKIFKPVLLIFCPFCVV